MHSDPQSWNNDYFKVETFELRRFRKKSYLTKAEPLKDTTAINPPPREFPVNSAALEINCPFPLVPQKTNRIFHTLPLKF